MSVRENHAAGAISGILAIVILVIGLALGVVYLVAGWTPICDRLGEIAFWVAIAGIVFSFTASQSRTPASPDEEEPDEEEKPRRRPPNERTH